MILGNLILHGPIHLLSRFKSNGGEGTAALTARRAADGFVDNKAAAMRFLYFLFVNQLLLLLLLLLSSSLSRPLTLSSSHSLHSASNHDATFVSVLSILSFSNFWISSFNTLHIGTIQVGYFYSRLSLSPPFTILRAENEVAVFLVFKTGTPVELGVLLHSTGVSGIFQCWYKGQDLFTGKDPFASILRAKGF